MGGLLLEAKVVDSSSSAVEDSHLEGLAVAAELV